jgi:hypothetical protein
VPDRELVPLVEATCPKDAGDPTDDPRTWYYALLDYGAFLKRTVPNPSRRSRSHVRQSRFEGSHRQKRAEVVRLLLEARQIDGGLTPDQVIDGLSQAEVFADSTTLSGIILTKMDGTAKGGIILAIKHKLHVPVLFIGLGEQPEDLRPFDLDTYLYSISEGLGNE